MSKAIDYSVSEEVKHQVPGEFQSIQAAYRLDGKNFLKWSQLVRTILKGKGKISHILKDGPAPTDPTFAAWDEEDSMIMAWLWGSMTPAISDTCMFLKTAKEIWDSVHQTYSKAKDAAQVYDVKVKTMAAKQEGKTVTEYANLLKSLWQELDHYRVIQTRCPEDAAVIKNYIEQDRIYDFLVGLNPEFDQVRVQILGRPEIPSLNEVIALVRSEESRRGLMLESSTTVGTVMLTNNSKGRNMSTENTQPTSQNRDQLWCTYCRKHRHTRDNCWKLNGRPQKREGREEKPKGDPLPPQGQVHAAVTTENVSKPTEASHFNQEEMDQLRALITRLGNSGTGSSAYSGQDHGKDDWTC